MDASKLIDKLIAENKDWRGQKLAELRKIILGVNPAIIEEWKWKGAPVWSLDGVLCFGNILSNRVKLGFLNGAKLPDPDKIFNAELEGNARRAIEYFENDNIQKAPLEALIKAAIAHNQSKAKK